MMTEVSVIAPSANAMVPAVRLFSLMSLLLR